MRGSVRAVEGTGVVGEQPEKLQQNVQPGDIVPYSSRGHLRTSNGRKHSAPVVITV